MAATTVRRRLTEVERAERVEALAAELAAAVQTLTDSAGWRSMLEVSARFRQYSLNNQLLLWAQATQRGMALTRVAAFGTWRKLGYRVRAGEKGLRIFGPVTRRLRADEVPSWLAQGRDPFDPDGRPRLVVRGFTVEYVFDLSQVDAGPDAQPDRDAPAPSAERERRPTRHARHARRQSGADLCRSRIDRNQPLPDPGCEALATPVTPCGHQA